MEINENRNIYWLFTGSVVKKKKIENIYIRACKLNEFTNTLQNIDNP